MEERMKDGNTAKTSGATLDDARPSRETFVASMQANFGGSRERWDKDYDKLLVAWGK